jgi:cyanophycinase-like exopeptidase
MFCATQGHDGHDRECVEMGKELGLMSGFIVRQFYSFEVRLVLG